MRKTLVGKNSTTDLELYLLAKGCSSLTPTSGEETWWSAKWVSPCSTDFSMAHYRSQVTTVCKAASNLYFCWFLDKMAKCFNCFWMGSSSGQSFWLSSLSFPINVMTAWQVKTRKKVNLLLLSWSKVNSKKMYKWIFLQHTGIALLHVLLDAQVLPHLLLTPQASLAVPLFYPCSYFCSRSAGRPTP